MRFVSYEIEPGGNYLYSIATRERLRESDKQTITDRIDRAMKRIGLRFEDYKAGGVREYSLEDLKSRNTKWSIMITYEPEEQTIGAEEIPPLAINKNYILFGIVESGDSKISEEEIEELSRETAEGIGSLKHADDSGEIAIVILQDCTVNRVVIKGPGTPQRIGIV